MQNKLSIIIPTYNRKQSLSSCLDSLLKQDALEDIHEIIIVDDGSTDGTEGVVEEKKKIFPALKYLYQVNKGPAVARNQGIKAAQGDILLFIGDDIIATPSLVREHLEWHNRYPKINDAVLGYITWSPEIKVTDFMQWLENGGPLLCYPLIKDKTEVDFRFFYTGNISLKSTLLKQNLFSEDFYYGYEDTELGYRLGKEKDLRILFNKEAIAYHHHYMTIEDFKGRMEKWGKAARVFLTKYPELKKTLRVYPVWFLRIYRWIVALLYPWTKIIGWRKIVYYHRYQISLMIVYSKSYFENK